MAESRGTQRLHALDALRATAMELGLILHAGVPYTHACPQTWAACDPSRSSGFDLLNTLIHAFRMPVFFCLSGFFAVLLLERVGARGFVAHRLRRIALPLLIACAVIVPLTRSIWIYGAFTRPGADLPGRYWPSLIAHFRDPGIRIWETIWHLWFLEYLLIFYALFLAARWLAPQSGSRVLDALAARLVGRARVLWLAIPTGLAMLAMRGWEVDGIGRAIPSVHMLGYYAIFFVAGTALYRTRDRIDSLKADWRWHLAAAGGVVLPAMVYARRAYVAAPTVWLDVGGRFASGLLTCLLLYGAMGLFVEHFARGRSSQRYLADAAYFVYLAHFPLIAWLGIEMAHLGLPASIKFAAVLSIAVPVLLTVYHLAVRHSVIGRTLHGPR